MLSVEEALAFSEPSSELRSVGSVLDILQKCRENKSLLHAKGMHLHICNQGLDGHEAVGVRLVPLFVECGSIPKAQQVFNRLNHQNEHCWTSLIQGFIDHGEPQRAFILFGKMQEDSVCPSRYTFVALLKAATKLKSIDKGHQIHAQVAVEGDEDDLFVGSSLVDMYAKFGLLAEAQEVFDELPARSVVSWTTLMAGYAEQGLGKEVMECLEKMQLEGVAPDAFTVVSILKACGSTGAVEKGREIHAQSAKEGFVRDPFVGNVLVDMYAKCGLLAEAQAVFDQLPTRDVVSWNALIAGHAEDGSTVKVLNSWEQMKLEGVIPNSVTFACILKACCNEVGAMNKGQELHSEIVKMGFESDLFVGNSLIGLYAKCGLSAEAQDVFDGLPVQGVISWTALIDGYAEHGLGQEALDRLKQMQLQGMTPNAVTFVCSLKACGSIGAVDKVQEIHAEISKEGYESDLFVISMLMDTYTKCGSLVEAREVFDMLSVRDVVSWTALISGYVEHGLGEEALKALEEMHKEHVSLNAITFVCVLKACGSTGAVDRGQELHCEIVKKGLEDDLVVCNSLVDVYAKCGLPAEAQAVFDNLSVQDVVSWTALIAGYAQRGLVKKAWDCFQEMQLEGVAPDVGSWNAMISAYADQGETEKACKSYAQMQEQGLSPNEMTFVSILKACGNAAALETGDIIHAQIRSIGLETTGVELANALVDLYGKCGSMVDAQELFDAMSVRDVVTWNALITGYARQGESELVLQLFERMRKERIRPDRITLLIVLSTCNHAGFVEKGQQYFQAMRKEYNIAPTAMHHNIMVDLYGRAGQFDKAAEMLEEMPFQPNFVTWSTMLGACQTLGNIDLGRQAFDYAMRMDQKDMGAFILMSNLYAGVGRLGTDNGELMNME